MKSILPKNRLTLAFKKLYIPYCLRGEIIVNCNNIKIIVNADDFGLNPNRNKAVLFAMNNNICTQASIIINSQFSYDAIEIAKKYKFMDKVGLHLNLTKDEPLSEDIKKISKYCFKNSFVESNPRSFTKVFSLLYIKDIRKEIDAQIKKFFDSGFTLRHLDFHNDVGFNLPIWLALRPLIKKYKIESIRGIEPYLFGFYRKSIIQYLPLKYYFLFFYKYVKLKNTLILGGGRNINHFVADVSGLNTRMKIGQIQANDVIEVIIHPDFKEERYIDNTNFDAKGNKYPLEDTKNKLNGFEKINYSKAYLMINNKNLKQEDIC